MATNEIKDLVKFGNELTLSFKDFKPKEKDLTMMWFSSFRGNGINKITISYDEIIKKGKFGDISIKRLYNIIEETGEKLTGVVEKFAMTYENGKRYSARFVLFPTWINDEERKTLTLSLNPDFVDFFNDFTGGNWTSFELIEYITLNSKYSKDMFFELKKWKTTGYYFVTIDDLRELLGIPESYEPKKIEAKIIKPMRQQLNGPFKNLTIEQETKSNHGKGRSSISAYEFKFDPQVSVSLSDEERERKAIEKSGGKPTEVKCPRCGKKLMEKKINNNNCWCHYDFKTGPCNAIFNSMSEIKEEWKIKKQEEESKQIMTDEQKDNRRRLEEMISGMTKAPDYLKD